MQQQCSVITEHLSVIKNIKDKHQVLDMMSRDFPNFLIRHHIRKVASRVMFPAVKMTRYHSNVLNITTLCFLSVKKQLLMDMCFKCPTMNKINMKCYQMLFVCLQASDGSSSRDDLPAQLLRRNDQIRKLEAKLSGRTCQTKVNPLD